MIKNFKNYINNFLENHKVDIYNDIYELNKKLTRFNFDDNIDIYEYFDCIKDNKIFIDILKNFVSKNKISINSNGLLQFDFCEELNSFIELFCDINGIDIKNEYEYDISLDTNSLYYNDMYNYSLLSREEEFNLFKEYEKDHDVNIRNKIATANLRLVTFVAKRYNYNSVFNNLDIIQEGNIGLLTAIDKYDVNKGYKFSTYAIWWIRQAISRALILKGETIRKTTKYMDYIRKYNRIKSELTNTLKRTPSMEEIAAEMEITVDYLNELLKLDNNLVSLNTKLGSDEDGLELEDTIIDDKTCVEDKYFDIELREELFKVLDKVLIDKRYKDIMFLRYGLYDGKIYTLNEISKKYGITKERVRQIEYLSLRRLRRYCFYKMKIENGNDLRLYLK